MEKVIGTEDFIYTTELTWVEGNVRGVLGTLEMESRLSCDRCNIRMMEALNI